MSCSLTSACQIDVVRLITPFDSWVTWVFRSLNPSGTLITMSCSSKREGLTCQREHETGDETHAAPVPISDELVRNLRMPLGSVPLSGTVWVNWADSSPEMGL